MTDSRHPFPTSPERDREAWLRGLRRYFGFVPPAHLAWEVLQLPLYTIWHQGGRDEIVFAVLHCTGGDILIAGAALLGALLIAGDGSWPHARFRAVATLAILGGLAYTILSEWINTEIRGSWAYTAWMPRLPIVGAGLAPVLQWGVVPFAAFWWVRRPFAGRELAKRSNS